MSQLLGMTIPDGEVERILQRLELEITPSGEGWEIAAPTFRVDLSREVDLIEEVGRHYGFDKLESTFPPMTVAVAPPDARITGDQLVRRVLTAAGLSEAVSFGFIESSAAQPFVSDGTPPVAIANPLSAKFEVLRPSLLPGLLEAVVHNRRYGRRDVGLFEIGSRFTATGGETRSAGLILTGVTPDEHWSGRSRAVDFFDLKGIVEGLYAAFGLDITVEPASVPFFQTGHGASVVADGRPVGVLGLISPILVEQAGAPRHDPILAAELGLDSLAPRSRDRVRPLPRHPAVVRDLSIVVSDTLPAEIIRGTIQLSSEAGTAPLVATGIFDRYKGKGVPEGSVSLSVRLTFQAPERTLTDEEVQETFDGIVAALARDHGAVQR
jgi:phenylalanyl-tRNA synthetase beta chain